MEIIIARGRSILRKHLKVYCKMYLTPTIASSTPYIAQLLLLLLPT